MKIYIKFLSSERINNSRQFGMVFLFTEIVSIFIVLGTLAANAQPIVNDNHPSIIRYDATKGTHIDLLPIVGQSPRSVVDFGNWALGQYSGIGGKDFFLYDGISHSHPLIVSPNDEVIVGHEYDNVRLPDAYDKLPSPLNVRIGYGRIKPAGGTAIGVQSNLDIFNEAIPKHGHNEFSSYYGYVRANNHGIHPPSQHYWVSDFQLTTPFAPDPTKSPELEIVYSGRMMNMSAGTDVLSSGHMGAYGEALVATPMLKNELADAGIPLDARSYPVTALLALSGFSGDANTYNGTLPSAGPAASYALRIGGGGGSPYIPYNARSNFENGIGVYDWSKTGIDIDRPLEGGTGLGLRNRTRTELGGDLPPGSLPYSLLLHDEHLGPVTAGIQIGDAFHAWILATSPDSSVGPKANDDAHSQFTIAFKSAKNPILTLTPNGIGFGGHAPVSPPKLHPAFDLSRKVDPQELARAYNTLREALISMGLAQ